MGRFFGNGCCLFLLGFFLFSCSGFPGRHFARPIAKSLTDLRLRHELQHPTAPRALALSRRMIPVSEICSSTSASQGPSPRYPGSPFVLSQNAAVRGPLQGELALCCVLRALPAQHVGVSKDSEATGTASPRFCICFIVFFP